MTEKRLTYADMHWGDRPRASDVPMYVLRRRWCRPGPRIASLSYATHKDGEVKVWEHAFGEQVGWRPRILWNERGRVRNDVVPATDCPVLALGRIVDVMLETGEKLHPVMSWVGCPSRYTGNGAPVLVMASYRVGWGIEHRSPESDVIWPYITPHGIIG